jgi:hypothetical protein
MHRSDWLLIAAALVVFAVLPPTMLWAAGRPAHSARRLAGLGMTGALVAAAVAAVVAWRHPSRIGPPAAILGGGLLFFALFLLAAIARRRQARRAERSQLYAPGNLISGPARLRIRPRKPAPAGGHRVTRRLDAWLAADGPAATQGWWNNGSLSVDAHGPALVDAAGLRHPLPRETTSLIQRSVPCALLLVDDTETVLARLPLTGFSGPELRRFAAAAGWRFGTTMQRYRVTADFLDLRGAVADRAARHTRLHPHLFRDHAEMVRDTP